LELTADLLKNGRGKSVQKFRQANIDGSAVNRLMQHAKDIATSPSRVLAALQEFTDDEIAMICYAVGIAINPGTQSVELRKAVVAIASSEGKTDVLVGELMRRKPDLLR
jgi:hypothetical protein